MSGADEIYALSADFGKAKGRIASALYDTYKDEAETFAEDWRSNVRAVAPNHLPHLPDAITAETKVSTNIVVEVGPETGRRQGALGKGDEFGSRNQPPHFSGLQAMGPAEKRIERAADATIGFLLP